MYQVHENYWRLILFKIQDCASRIPASLSIFSSLASDTTHDCDHLVLKFPFAAVGRMSDQRAVDIQNIIQDAVSGFSNGHYYFRLKDIDNSKQQIKKSRGFISGRGAVA